MKTVRILFEHCGENLPTGKQPVAVVLSVMDHYAEVARYGKPRHVDLDEEKTVCLSFDNDMLTQTSRYEIREVQIPDWMTPDESISYDTDIAYFQEFGGNLDWGRKWFFKIIQFGEAQKLAAIKLLNTKKFRSTFRQSLHDQLEAWLNDDKPNYESPFSRKQWDGILDAHTRREARNKATNLYYSRR